MSVNVTVSQDYIDALGSELAALRALNAEAMAAIELARRYAARLCEWDALQGTADGPYWKQEAELLRDALAALLQRTTNG